MTYFSARLPDHYLSSEDIKTFKQFLPRRLILPSYFFTEAVSILIADRRGASVSFITAREAKNFTEAVMAGSVGQLEILKWNFGFFFFFF